MINHRWTKKGLRFAVTYYGGEPKKMRSGGTYDTFKEAQDRSRELKSASALRQQTERHT